ncbi:glycosyltransferase [Alphaproteobacteria bacterium]|nr:glycosyltransferase [Alphaproteobacteria bacterium]
MNKIVFYQNIVTPYRIELFNYFHNISLVKGFAFDVFFSRLSKKNRFLPFDLASVRFNHYFSKFILGLPFRNNFFVFDFSFILFVFKQNKNTFVMLGSSWNDLSILFLAIFKRLGFINATLCLWVEANYLTKRELRGRSALFIRFRYFIINSFSDLCIPGIISLKSLEMWGLSHKNIHYLPNLINPDKVSNLTFSKKFRSKPYNFITIARFTESDKGLCNLLRVLNRENFNFFHWTIIGDGPDRYSFEVLIDKLGISSSVSILGNRPRDFVIESLMNADVFLLPSLSDPNPISVVEALKSGLPLLVSNRIGNLHEALSEGVNGYSFDPLSASSVNNAFSSLFAHTSLSSLSSNSKLIFNKNFNIEVSINSFLDSINL